MNISDANRYIYIEGSTGEVREIYKSPRREVEDCYWGGYPSQYAGGEADMQADIAIMQARWRQEKAAYEEEHDNQ